MQYQYRTHYTINAHINKTIITVALGVLDQIKMVWSRGEGGRGLNRVLGVSELSGQRFSRVRTLPSQLARAGSVQH